MTVALAAKFAAFLGSVLYFHYRGRERLSFRRQLTDHSTFLAPYNLLIDLASGRLYEAGYVRASERHEDLGFESFFRRGWKRFYLTWYGRPLPSARSLCPKTVELVESIPSVHGALFTLIRAAPGGL